MKYLVTGGAGFIGSNLVDKLVEENHEVIIVDDLSTGRKENINVDAKLHTLDISLSESLPYLIEILKGVDAVFHLAAKARVQPSIDDPVGFNKVNVNGTLNILKACVESNVLRFVFSSSSSVYGDTTTFPTPETAELKPMSPYALQKLIGEQYCKLFSELYGINTVCLRYFNVYGERQSLDGAYALVMGIFANQMLNNQPMTVRGDGEQRRDFTYVGDVVDANIRAANFKRPVSKINHHVVNIGNGDNRSVNDIANILGGKTINVDPVIEPMQTLADNSNAGLVLKWKPTVNIEEWAAGWKREIGL